MPHQKKIFKGFQRYILVLTDHYIALIDEEKIYKIHQLDSGSGSDFSSIRFVELKPDKFLITTKIKKCFQISLNYRDHLNIEHFTCDFGQFDQIYTADKLLTTTSNNELFFWSFQNKSIVLLGSRKLSNPLKLLNAVKFNKLYYLIFENELYFLDNYILEMKLVHSFQIKIEKAVSVKY